MGLFDSQKTKREGGEEKEIPTVMHKGCSKEGNSL